MYRNPVYLGGVRNRHVALATLMQRQIRIEGTLTACKCGRQPKHWHDLRGNNGNGTHFIECSLCPNRRPAFGTFNESVAEWEQQYERQELAK
jgi:hypothetical protein